MPAGLGVAWIAHVLPFRTSASVISTPPELRYCPTAVQLVVEVHQMLVNWLKVVPAGLGVAWTYHPVPFQCSASVTMPPVLLV